MVLTFANWNDWSSDTGTSGSIDWDHIETTPHTLVYEALRQALAERIAAFGLDPLALYREWAAVSVNYRGMEQLAEPVQTGVDMDEYRKLHLLGEMAEIVANFYPWPPAPIGEGSIFYPYYIGPLNAYDYHTSSEGLIPADLGSAARARWIRGCLSACRTLRSDLSGNGVGSAAGEISVPTPVPGWGTIAIGQSWLDYIHLSKPLDETMADFGTRFASQPWGVDPSPIAPTVSLFYGYFRGDVTGYGDLGWPALQAGYRYRKRLRFEPNSSLAREYSIWGVAGTDYGFPEGGYTPYGEVRQLWTSGTVAGPVETMFGDSKAMPSLAYWHTYWGLSGGVWIHFSVPGGFVFQGDEA